MKSTKLRIVSAAGIAVLGLAAFNGMAQAATAQPLELADVLNADMDQLIEINTNVTHPLGPVLDGMASSFSESSGLTQDQMDKLKTVLEKNTITFATKNVSKTSNGYTYNDPDVYASFHIAAADLDSIGCTIHCPSETEQIGGVMVYAPEGDTGSKFITYIGDLFIMTNSRETMNNVINNYNSLATAQTLGKSAGYMEVRSKTLGGSFFNMYVNPSQYQNLNDGSSVEMLGLSAFVNAEKDLVAALKAEGISVTQTDTGFNFSVFVKGDDAKLTELNLNFDRYNFIPELYKYVNSNNIIMFGEENNLKAKFNDFLKLFMSDAESMKAFTDWKAQLKTDANIDFDTEILPVLGGKYAVSIHKTAQIWPAVTLLIDVRGQIGTAGSTLNKLMTYADKTFNALEAEENSDFYNRDVSFVNGVAYYQLTLDPTKSAGTDPEIANLGSEKAKIVLHAAVTPDGFLVITNAPNVSDAFVYDNKGMLNNPTFSQSFTPGETLSGLGFFSVDGLQDYADMMMDTFSAPTEARTFFDGVLDPWHDVFTKGYATSDTASATGFVNVDTAGFAKYPDLFNTAFNIGYEESVGSIQEPFLSENFCDVHDGDWFAPYVGQLSTDGIVRGYEDGCFRPANAITRAEFLKMAIEATNDAGMMSYESMNMDLPSNTFSDVHASDWYAHYVDQGIFLNWIKGYSDNTFRPNASITRAEALQILFNSDDALKNVDTSATFDIFNDVSESDWYVNPVNAAYAKGLVQGVTDNAFEPDRNINRAEAAKIIKLFLDLKKSEKDQMTQPGMMRPIDYTQQETQQTTPNVY